MGGIEESGFNDNFLPTFVVNTVPTTLVANVPAIALLNRNASYIVRLWSANIFCSTIINLLASLMVFRLRMFTATATLIGGAAVTPASMDPSVDVFPASIDIRKNATEAGDWVKDELFRSMIYSSDEPVVSRPDANMFSSQVFPRDSHTWFRGGQRWEKPPTMRVRSDGITFEGFVIENGSIAAAGANIGVQFTITVESA